MKIIQPSVTVHWDPFVEDYPRLLSLIYRVSYQTQQKHIDHGMFLRQRIKEGHLSPLEHFSISVTFIASRGFTHELIRHRHGSFTQESTRFCNYKDGITIIDQTPFLKTKEQVETWTLAMVAADAAYSNLLEIGCRPEIARAVLPICLKSEIRCSMNLRTWREVFQLRTTNHAHPEMRLMMTQLLRVFQHTLPEIFGDIVPYEPVQVRCDPDLLPYEKPDVQSEEVVTMDEEMIEEFEPAGELCNDPEVYIQTRFYGKELENQAFEAVAQQTYAAHQQRMLDRLRAEEGM